MKRIRISYVLASAAIDSYERPRDLRVGYDMTPGLVSPAGVGRYARALCRALSTAPGVSLDVLVASRRRPTGALSRAVQGLFRESAYYPLLLARRARARSDAVVHCPAPFSPRVSALPLVVTVHDMIAFRRPELFPPVIVLQSRWQAEATLRRATRLIAVSSYTRDEVVDLLGIPAERVAVVPSGVDHRFHPTPRDPDWLRARFGIQGRFVLCVGTLEPRKNLAGALRAFEAAGPRLDDCALVIAGGRGWRNEQFEEALRRVRTPVHVTGYVSDEELVRLYGASECFLFPSLDEGFGFPVLEAMACGTPVIAGDRTSVAELTAGAGLLVDPTDPEAMADAVTRVLDSESLSADLRERGLARARRYSWAATAEATVAVYREAKADWSP